MTPSCLLSIRAALPRAWLALVVVTFSTLARVTADAATPLLDVAVSPDVAVSLSSTFVSDRELGHDDLAGMVSTLSFPGIPDAADVVGHHVLVGGDRLLALDTAALLPSTPSAIAVRAGDVVRYDGADYTLEFDATSVGIPDGVVVDAVTTVNGDLLLSFDTAVSLAAGSIVADDEDLVRWSGATFSLFWDGSAAGVPGALDVDAAHWIDSVSALLVSFDGSGQVGLVAFDDEDLLERWEGAGTWELAYDASAQHVGWSGGPDLDAATGSSDPDGDGLSDLVEAERGTNPLNADSDGDALTDDVETDTGVFVSGSDTGTDPLDPDSDGDGWVDGAEVTLGTDPNDPQSVPIVPVPALPAVGLGTLALVVGALGAARLRSRTRRSTR